MSNELTEAARTFLANTAGRFTIDPAGIEDGILYLVTPSPTDDLRASAGVVESFLAERGYEVGTFFGSSDAERDANSFYYRPQDNAGYFQEGNIVYGRLNELVDTRDILGNAHGFELMDIMARDEGYVPSAMLATIVNIPEGTTAAEVATQLARAIREASALNQAASVSLSDSDIELNACVMPIENLDAPIAPPAGLCGVTEGYQR